MITMVAGVSSVSISEAMRVVEQQELSLDGVIEKLQYKLDNPEELQLFDQEIIDRTHKDLWGSPGQKYMNGRGFTDETLEYFDIGYSEVQNAVMVPVHSPQGLPMGVVGRLLDYKKFLNSTGLQGRKTLFNIHRAKRHGGRLIIVEASFDAMKIHQAGYPNVAALIKGTFTEEQEEIVKRMFDEVIIFVDNDNPHDYPHLSEAPGRALGKQIYNKLKGSMQIYKVPFEAYGGLKDATDMTIEQISYAIHQIKFMGLDINA